MAPPQVTDLFGMRAEEERAALTAAAAAAEQRGVTAPQ